MRRCVIQSVTLTEKRLEVIFFREEEEEKEEEEGELLNQDRV
jgi:hypothetical protein